MGSECNGNCERKFGWAAVGEGSPLRWYSLPFDRLLALFDMLDPVDDNSMEDQVPRVRERSPFMGFVPNTSDSEDSLPSLHSLPPNPPREPPRLLWEG